jgi:putative transposase
MPVLHQSGRKRQREGTHQSGRGTFATVRHRTICSKGRLSNKTALAMVFNLVEAAQRAWRRLDGRNQLPKVILDVKFADGLEVTTKPTTTRQPTTAAA